MDHIGWALAHHERDTHRGHWARRLSSVNGDALAEIPRLGRCTCHGGPGPTLCSIAQHGSIARQASIAQHRLGESFQAIEIKQLELAAVDLDEAFVLEAPHDPRNRLGRKPQVVGDVGA